MLAQISVLFCFVMSALLRLGKHKGRTWESSSRVCRHGKLGPERLSHSGRKEKNVRVNMSIGEMDPTCVWRFS